MNQQTLSADPKIQQAPTISRAAISTVESLPFQQFVWGAGIECSFIPHLNIDQFNWTQHNRFWKEDFRRAKEELGVTHLRYAFPWHLIEAERGRFDWSIADERVEELDRLGIKLLLDVMHFGTPLWMKQAVGDPEFPEAMERFAEAMVGRYGKSVDAFVPCNEPLVLALFSGDFGFWPPHSRKWRGYMPVLSRIVQGTMRAMRAIRRVKPEATILHVDASENYKTRNEELRDEVKRRNLRRFIVMDLMSGRVDKYHPLYPWLVSYGMSELDLEWFRSNPQLPDVLGLDYYPHSDWQLDMVGKSVRQRRAESPAGLYGVANAYWKRYGIPMMVTETSVEGQTINREIWLEMLLDDSKALREEGVPMLGLVWWPMIDSVDWDGAMTHRIGKIHGVGLYHLTRQPDGSLKRDVSPLVEQFARARSEGEKRIGRLETIAWPSFEAEDEQLPPIGEWIQPSMTADATVAREPGVATSSTVRGNGNGSALKTPASDRVADPAPGLSAEPSTSLLREDLQVSDRMKHTGRRATGPYGIVVFSHLRWGFVWQRPQQFLSRFAKKHKILFVEEPMFDLAEGSDPRVDYHRVMPNVTVVTPHAPHSWNRNPKLPGMLRQWTAEAIEAVNEGGEFDLPLLWYYSPMDASWSLGHFENRGVVYDCMDELSQFTGAPKELVQQEARLMQHADIVFTGGYNLGEKKRKQHQNVHTFGCGVEYSHFGKAQDENTPIPPDIDFMARPILGWFGVVDERVDYAMVGEMARARPHWSFAMVGPVVKVDPNLVPHNPNLFWMGSRDYQVLPNYCRAFDICMMPFAMNASTEFINPTKGLEYMATGRPIISTPVRDVVKQWSDIIHVVRNADEFLAAADKIIQNTADVQQRVQKGIELARKCSWENTVQTMQELIKAAIESDDRRSKQKIEPLSEIELSYQYVHTPGS
jgi:beta-glucosidase/6-phospho-beta-glucosidase/beta-galactosidase/glycosyltransferase involved in cell wall biosynthesis